MEFVGVGDGGKGQDLPALALQHMSDEIVLVQALHDDHDDAPGLVVEAGIEGSVEPFVGRRSAAFRHGVARFHRIVDQDQIRPAAREHAADRCRHAEAAAGRGQLLKRSAG
jgi:hypothetical protein